jgi:hypothetical protein
LLHQLLFGLLQFSDMSHTTFTGTPASLRSIRQLSLEALAESMKMPHSIGAIHEDSQSA